MRLTVYHILSLWPHRRAVLDDARKLDPDLDIVAVHRWFQRGSVPGRFWAALLEGALHRGLPITAEDFVMAHDGRKDAA